MIDLHCHLLPGVDDGPRTLDEALALARALLDDGVTLATATPHVHPGRYENRRASIEQAASALREALACAGLPLALACAGEVRMTPEVMPLIDAGEVPFLGECDGCRTLLLEWPDGQIPLGMDDFARWLARRRIRPVIAHPERNRAVMAQPERLERLVDAGCYLQITAGSLVGGFGARAQATATRLLDAGWVHAIASDAHNLGARRPMMRRARDVLRQRYGDGPAERLTEQGPAALGAAMRRPAGLAA